MSTSSGFFLPINLELVFCLNMNRALLKIWLRPSCSVKSVPLLITLIFIYFLLVSSIDVLEAQGTPFQLQISRLSIHFLFDQRSSDDAANPVGYLSYPVVSSGNPFGLVFFCNFFFLTEVDNAPRFVPSLRKTIERPRKLQHAPSHESEVLLKCTRLFLWKWV